MKSLLSTTPGGPETLRLEELPAPVPGPGQVLVDVKACGVNFPDVQIIEDRYPLRPERPFAPGSEVSGVVRRLGDAVTGLSVGQRVLGYVGWGGMSQALVADADRLIPFPDAMPFDEAAAFLMTYATAYHALRDRGHLRAGQSLLVLGAAGGVGLAAVELGAAIGAEVVAAASSSEKVEVARRHGADAGVVYRRGPFDPASRAELAAQFAEAGRPGGFDVVYDGVGGDYSQAALQATAWGGRFLVVGFSAGIASIALDGPVLRGCDVVGVLWGAAAAHDPTGQRRNVDELFALYAAGKIRPYVTERYPLAKGGEAIAKLARREALGKIVVLMD
jgi:NADPH2:quinone reductase